MDFDALFAEMELGECDHLEAKLAREGLGKSFLETVCAFSNKPGMGGGYIFLGVQEKDEVFTIRGASDPERIQNEVASLCRSNFNISIRPKIQVFPDRKNVIMVHIEEAKAQNKPVYIKSKGMHGGAFRRIGASDQRCMTEDLQDLFQRGLQKRYEEKELLDTSWGDIDPKAIEEYRRVRQGVYADASELMLSDIDLLHSLHAVTEFRGKLVLTVAGLVLFGSKMALRRLLPLATRVDYILVGGTEWVPDPDRRFHSVEFSESLITMMPRLLNCVMQDIPLGFSLDEKTMRRKDIPLIPYAAVREGIANALMHRDYFTKSPTQVIRYANRLEFRNAGSSMKPLAQMNTPGSVARNENVAMVFHDLNFAENKGTGIRTMKDAMLKANLSVPLIESSRDYNTFNLCLLPHHFFDKSDVDWLAQFKQMNLTDEEAKALIVIRELGAITNADYRQMNHVDTLTASQSLRKFRDYGLIYQKGTASKTYYIPAERLTNNEAPQTTPQTTGLPASVREQLNKASRKISARELQEIIKSLCKWQPQKLANLAALLKRNPKHLREHYLTPMLKSHELEYAYPENPAHPMQAYKLKGNTIQS